MTMPKYEILGGSTMVEDDSDPMNPLYETGTIVAGTNVIGSGPKKLIYFKAYMNDIFAHGGENSTFVEAVSAMREAWERGEEIKAVVTDLSG